MLLRREDQLPCGCMAVQGNLVNAQTDFSTQDWQSCDTSAGSATMLNGSVVQGDFELRCSSCPNVWR